MKHAVLFVTLVFLASLVAMGWTNGGLFQYEGDQVLGTQSSFWSRWFGKIRWPKAVPTRGVVMPAPSTAPSGAIPESDDPEIDISNLEQELRSLDQEMNALKLLD